MKGMMSKVDKRQKWNSFCTLLNCQNSTINICKCRKSTHNVESNTATCVNLHKH